MAAVPLGTAFFLEGVIAELYFLPPQVSCDLQVKIQVPTERMTATQLFRFLLEDDVFGVPGHLWGWLASISCASGETLNLGLPDWRWWR